MPDVEIDPLTGRRVAIVSHRQRRPNLPSEGECPFCPGGLEAPSHYSTHHFPNRWPPLPDERAEVLLYSPRHDASLATLTDAEARSLVDLWADRTQSLGQRADVAYVLVFENRGSEVGATISHPHGQLYAYDTVPPAALRELESESCALCGAEATDCVVGEIQGWRVSVPELAAWPYELLIAPHAHVGDLPSLDAANRDALASILVRSVRALDEHFGAETPLMLWVHQRPTDAQPWPNAHVHLHITPIWRAPGVVRFVAAAELGSDLWFNPITPADAADQLRRAF